MIEAKAIASVISHGCGSISFEKVISHGYMKKAKDL